METLRQWFTTPTEEQAFLALTPSIALSSWLSGDSKEHGNAPKEAPYLISGSWGISLISHIRSVIWNDGLIQKGYEEASMTAQVSLDPILIRTQYQDGMFKIPFFGQWATVVSGKYIDEIIRAPETQLSFQKTLNDQLQLEYLVGPALSDDHVHLALIRTLNRNLEAIYPDILDESDSALEHALGKGKQDNDWTSVKGFDFSQDVVYRLNQRVFVGLPLSREEEWEKADKKRDMALIIRAYLLKAFPKTRRADANEYITRFAGPASETKQLTDIITERLAMPEEERPNNMLSWILARVDGGNPEPKVVAGVLSLLTMVAQSTTSMSFTHAFFHLVAHPEYAEMLREDISDALVDGELTFESLGRMRKLDSFLREAQRLSIMGTVTLARIAVQDFFFSNGVCVPAGELVMTMATPVHHDPTYYEDPLEFKPWRFYDLAHGNEAETAARSKAKYDVVTPSKTYLTWGLGKHACPGRWYATMVIKHLFAYLILNYEFKLPDSAKGQRPADFKLAGACAPNLTARLLFRKLQKETGEQPPVVLPSQE